MLAAIDAGANRFDASLDGVGGCPYAPGASGNVCSEWSTGVALVLETWPEHARAKGAGFPQSAFGCRTMLAAVIWYPLSSTHPLGTQTWRLMFIAGALPAFFALYLRRGLSESEKWQQAVRDKRWNATADADGRHAVSAGKSDRRPFTLK